MFLNSFCFHCNCDLWFIVSPINSVIMEFGYGEFCELELEVSVMLDMVDFPCPGLIT